MNPLEGERIVVRPVGLDDAELLARVFGVNEAHVAPWHSGPLDSMRDAAWWRERLPKMLEDPRHLRMCFFVRADDAEVGGLVNLHEIVRHPVHAAMFGYSIAKRWEGQGLMSEALALVIQHAFSKLNLHKLHASFDVVNVRSKRLLERAGFVYEGRLRSHLLVGGSWRDLDQMSLINSEWTPP